MLACCLLGLAGWALDLQFHHACCWRASLLQQLLCSQSKLRAACAVHWTLVQGLLLHQSLLLYEHSTRVLSPADTDAKPKGMVLRAPCTVIVVLLVTVMIPLLKERRAAVDPGFSSGLALTAKLCKCSLCSTSTHSIAV